jgi:hypothetical protein
MKHIPMKLSYKNTRKKVWVDPKLYLKMYTEFKNSFTFAPTVPVLLPIRTAHGSFFLIGFTTKLIHLFCLSLMHTEGVFSFNNILQNA